MHDDRTQVPLTSKPHRASLVFGFDLTDPALSNLSPPIETATVGHIDAVNAKDLQQRGVFCVVCPLFSPEAGACSDAMTVIDRLASVGFGGEVVVLAPPLLRPKMVENELRTMARGMKLRLIPGALAPLNDI